MKQQGSRFASFIADRGMAPRFAPKAVCQTFTCVWGCDHHQRSIILDEFEPRDASNEDEARYRILVDAITDFAIYMLDPTGIVTSWNTGAQRFKGYSAQEIIGQHFSRFYTREEREARIPEILAWAFRWFTGSPISPAVGSRLLV